MTLTAGELIEKLKTLPPHAVLYVWIDGERYPIHTEDTIDLWDVDQYRVIADINCKTN